MKDEITKLIEKKESLEREQIRIESRIEQEQESLQQHTLALSALGIELTEETNIEELIKTKEVELTQLLEEADNELDPTEE